MKVAEVQKIIEKKEELKAQAPMTNIYDNTPLFKRETIESKIEKHPMLEQGPPDVNPGEA